MIRVIWNPVSGRGRGARLHAAVRTAFAAQGITDFQATTAPGDEAHLVHQALDDGVATIVAVGGDGTWGKCAVALAKAGSPARIAFVAAGTGNDFAKNLRAPAHNLHAMAQLIAGGGVERRVDLGRVDDAWFANVAGLGFDVAALRAATRVRFLRGSSVYVVAALRELFDFPGLEARVQGMAGVDPQPMLSRLMLVIANGKEFGGAFRIAPEARVMTGGSTPCSSLTAFAPADSRSSRERWWAHTSSIPPSRLPPERVSPSPAVIARGSNSTASCIRPLARPSPWPACLAPYACSIPQTPAARVPGASADRAQLRRSCL